MRESKRFLRSTTGIVLFTLGLSIALVGFTFGVVIEENDDASQGPTISGPKDYVKDARKGQDSYDVIPPFQDPSQLYPAYPGRAGTQLPVPPTEFNPNADQQNIPMSPTAQAPYGSPSQSQGGGGSRTGGNQGMAPGSPMSGGGGRPVMPSSPTPGQNLNQLGIADPQYGRFESARLEASLGPHKATQMNAARNKVIRGGKAFSGYRQPTAYSPYMSLLRTEDTIRGIDNYYEYVMPQIEQQQKNRQLSRDIGGLRSTVRSGYNTLQEIKQRPGNAPVQSGSRAPATFMNTGGYFGTGK